MITYWEYIKLDQLLTIQGGVEGRGDVALTDEMHFIGIHQAIELLFKLLLRELRSARERLNARYVPDESMPEVVKHLGRANEALRVAIAHFNYMELLTPLDFLEFRDKLGTSSGAQSFQMRELENLLGLTLETRQTLLKRLRGMLSDPSHADAFEGFILDPLGAITAQIDQQIALKAQNGQDDATDRWARDHIQRAQKDIEDNGTMRSALGRWLYRTPICDSTPPPRDDTEQDHEATARDREIVRQFTRDYLKRAEAVGWRPGQLRDVAAFLGLSEEAPVSWERERVRAAMLFIELYNDLPLLAWPRMVLEKVVEMEKLSSQFRGAHARMVERVIGSRPGTGGSPGLLYLDLTRDLRFFPELVQIRGILIPRDQRWAFPDMQDFGFRM